MNRSIQDFLLFEEKIDSFDIYKYKNVNFYGALRVRFAYSLFLNSKESSSSSVFRLRDFCLMILGSLRTFSLNLFRKSSVIFLVEFNDYQFDREKVAYEVFETMFDFLRSRKFSFDILKFKGNNENATHFRNYNEVSLFGIYNLVATIAKLISPICYIFNYRKFKSISSHFYYGTFSPIRCSVFLSETYLMYILSKFLIRIKEPKYFVCSSFTSLPFQGILLAAKERGIDFIDVQHGTIFDLNYTYTRNFVRINQLPDKYLVYSNFELEKLKHLNCVYPTGNLRIEFYNKYKRKKIEECESFVLFTLQYDITEEMLNYFFESYVILVKQYNLNVKIRLHPRSINNEELLNKIKFLVCKQEFDEIISFSSKPLFEVLHATKLHVTINSSVVLDALNFGVQSLVLSSKFTDDFNLYSDTGLVRVINMECLVKEVLIHVEAASKNSIPETTFNNFQWIFNKILSE